MTDVKSAQAEAPTLTINDIANALIMLDAAIKAGVYQPDDIEAVGNTRNRLKAYVGYHAELQAAAQAEANEAEAEVVEEKDDAGAK